MTARTWRLPLALTVGIAGCSRSESPPDLDASRAFQATYDAALRDGETTALTAIASYYVEPGRTVVVGVRDGKLVTDPSPTEPAASFSLGDRGFSCVAGCGPGPVPIAQRSVFTLSTLRLEASPQAGPGRVLVHDPQSPARTGFSGLSWFPVDARYVRTATLTPIVPPTAVTMTTSRGLTKTLWAAATLAFELEGQAVSLTGFTFGAKPQALPAAVFVPFGDASNGDTTYPAGRYLDVEVAAGASRVVVDFNRAHSPLCAYSEHYNCPVPPPENRLTVGVAAGERYAGHP